MTPTFIRRRQERPSIFEHVKAHVRDETAGLTAGGEELPDEETFSEGGISFAPGALEGAFIRYAEPSDDEAAVEKLHAALVSLADQPSGRARRRVRALFREGDVRARIEPLTARLRAFLPRHPERLYPEMREIFLRSGERDEVKYAMVLMSTFGRTEDAELFRTIGRHEEFTLYSAIALANLVDDPVEEWLGLLPHVSGWGRTELSELILREPQPKAIREKLLREGLGIGNALRLAEGCRLHELLARPDVDDELLARSRDVIDVLVWSWDSPSVLTDYEHAGEAVESLLGHLVDRARSLDEFISAFELRRLLTDKENRHDEESGEDAFQRAGFDEERLERVLGVCAELTARERWLPKAEAALASDEADGRSKGMEAGGRLGLDLHDYVIEQLRADPGDPGLWYRLVAGGDEERVREAVRLAEELWDLSEIARGPALDYFGGPSGPLACADFLLQELPRFPGVGGPLIGASLLSPIVRHRFVALRALSRWEEKPADLLETAERLAREDPDDEVRGDAAKVVAGQVLEDPGAELETEPGLP